jgi:hypothetical protein
VLGDYNIAPEARDVHDPKLWEGKVLFSEPERAAFRGLIGLGLKDGFRLFEQPEKSYTWWDYRMNQFKRNMGLRIDHILLSPELASRAVSSAIHKDVRAQERPSDHAPVVVEVSEGTSSFAPCSGLSRRVLALDLQLLDLASERIAAQPEQVRGFDPPPAGVRERAHDQRALELARHLVHDVLLAPVERHLRLAL